MNKRTLVDAVLATDAVPNRTAASAAVEAMLEAIASGLADGQQVFLQGFGTLDVRQKKGGVARKRGSNPPVYLVTGERVTVRFRPHVALRKRLGDQPGVVSKLSAAEFAARPRTARTQHAGNGMDGGGPVAPTDRDARTPAPQTAG